MYQVLLEKNVGVFNSQNAACKVRRPKHFFVEDDWAGGAEKLSNWAKHRRGGER